MSRGIDGFMRALGGAVLPHSVSQSELCPKGCGEHLQFGTDAIGRETARCPKCDGVARPRRINPNEALIPQGLVPAFRQLPPAVPGQPCAHCGHVVPEPKRVRAPKSVLPDIHCRGCGDVIPRKHGRPAVWCQKMQCLAKAPKTVVYARREKAKRRAAMGGA